MKDKFSLPRCGSSQKNVYQGDGQNLGLIGYLNRGKGREKRNQIIFRKDEWTIRRIDRR